MSVGVQAVERIEHGDRRDVARAEHQGHRALRVLSPVERRDVVAQRRRGHLGPHPHLEFVAVEQQSVVGVRGEDAGDHLSVRTGRDPDTLQGISAGVQTRERVDHLGEPRRGGVRPAQPLLASDDGRLRVEVLHLHAGLHPRVGVGHEQVAHLRQVGDAVLDREPRPAVLVSGEAFQRLVDGAQIHGGPSGGRTSIYRTLYR